MAQDKVYVGGLSYNTTEEGLKEAFSQFGDIKQANLITDRDNNNRSKGFAFITFESQAGAEAALSLDGTSLDGRTIKVNMAQDKKPGGSTGGGRGRW